MDQEEVKIYFIGKLKIRILVLVGRSLKTISLFNGDTPSNSPNLNRIEITVNNHRYQRKTSTGSSLSRASSEDDSHCSYPQIPQVTYISGILMQPINSRPLSRNLTALRKMFISGNICPRCSKIVYLAEAVKAVGKVNSSNPFLSILFF